MRRITTDTITAITIAVLIGWTAAIARGDEFLDALNLSRASRGLLPVVALRGAEGISEANNAQQRRFGMGHYTTGGYGQCAASHCSSVRHALQRWTDSPDHAALIYAPNLSGVYFAWDGFYASVATWQGQVPPLSGTEKPKPVVSTVAPPVPPKTTPQATPAPAKPANLAPGGCCTSPAPGRRERYVPARGGCARGLFGWVRCR